MIFINVVGAEFAKLRRSKVVWITPGVYTFMATMSGLMLWMMRAPEAAKRLGLLGQKANFAFGGQSVDWHTFLGFTVEMGGLGGLIVASVIAVFVFGREYAEGTAKNMLALPVPREFLVLAAMDLCCAMLAAWVAVETRGYFAAFGFVIFTLALASVFGRTGWAPWVPWCVVGIYSGAAGEGIGVGWGSYATLAATFIVGTGLTLRHELFADNVQ